MTVTLQEAKNYLRVDYPDDDTLINSMMTASKELVADIARMHIGEVENSIDENLKIAILYATAYLYEHREEADHHELMLTLRSLLFGVREAAF